MNKKNRVIRAIEGKHVDKVPMCFSLHFPPGNEYGKSAVDAHLKFFKETDTDIIKIMNENLVPADFKVRTPDDWKQISKISIKDPFVIRQMDLVDRILDQYQGSAFSVGTIHGIVASVLHVIEKYYGYNNGRELISEHLSQNQSSIIDAFKYVTELMTKLAEKYIDKGLDGIYYAALGESHYFTADEYKSIIEPLDKTILTAVKEKDGYNIFHICKDNIDLGWFKTYEELIDVVNWGVYESGISLAEGKKKFPNTTIMGGLKSRGGILENGTSEEIKKKIESIISEFGERQFILGADCTLSTDIEYSRIKKAVDYVSI